MCVFQKGRERFGQSVFIGTELQMPPEKVPDVLADGNEFARSGR